MKKPTEKTEDSKITRKEAQQALFMARALLLGSLANCKRSWVLCKNIETSYELEPRDRCVASRKGKCHVRH